MWTKTKRMAATLGTLGVVVLSGCDDLPSSPEADTASAQEVGAEVAAAVEASFDLLPTMEDLEAKALAALADAPPGADVEADLLAAGELDIEAAEALEGGDPVTAGALAAWSENAYFDALLTALGDDIAADLVRSVETAVGRVEAARSGERPGRRVERALNRARARIHEARDALGRGNAVEATRAGVDAAGEIRDLNPGARARHVVGTALQLLARAKELAGPDPRPEIAKILREAEARCDKATRALGEGAWREAIRLARQSAAISGRVIGYLSGVDRPDVLQERAEQAVAHAKELFVRVGERVGGGAGPEVEALLTRARALLAKADAALDDQNWREALVKAREAATILQRVIRYTFGA